MKWYSANKSAKLLGISPNTLAKWRLQRKIKAKKRLLGGRPYWEISAKEIKRIKSQLVKQKIAGKPILNKKI